MGEYQKGSEDLGEDETVFNDGDATDRAPKRPLNVFFLFIFVCFVSTTNESRERLCANEGEEKKYSRDRKYEA